MLSKDTRNNFFVSKILVFIQLVREEMSRIDMDLIDEAFIIFIGYNITLAITFFITHDDKVKLFIFLAVFMNWFIMLFIGEFPILIFYTLLMEILIISINISKIRYIVGKINDSIYIYYGESKLITLKLLNTVYFLCSFLFSTYALRFIYGDPVNCVAYISCFCLKTWNRSCRDSFMAESMGLSIIHQLLPFTQVVIIVLFFILIFYTHLLICIKISNKNIIDYGVNHKRSILFEWFFLTLIILILLVAILW